MKSDKRKQSLYLPYQMLKEVKNEAHRQDRSLSWIIQQAWEAARIRIQQLPSAPNLNADSEPRNQS